MADNTITPNLGLIKVGRGVRSFDGDINDNWDKIDEALGSRVVVEAIWDQSGGLPAGTCVALSTYSGSGIDLQMTLANMASGAHTPAQGVLLEDVEFGQVASVARQGILNVPGSTNTFTPGSLLYVGAQGLIEDTQATAFSSNTAIQIVGYAQDEDTIFLDLRPPIFPRGYQLSRGVQFQGGSITNSFADSWDNTNDMVVQTVTADSADHISLMYQIRVPDDWGSYPGVSQFKVLDWKVDATESGSVQCEVEVARVIDTLGSETSTGLPGRTAISSSPTGFSLTGSDLPGLYSAGSYWICELRLWAGDVGDVLRVLDATQHNYLPQIEF